MTSQNPLILHVEPSISCAKLMELLISRINNYEIIHASNGDDALDMAINLQPCLILTEMNLSYMTGLELLTRIRNNKSTKHIPMLAVSANSHQTDINHALAQGLDGYITKPFVLRDLYGKIRDSITSNY